MGQQKKMTIFCQKTKGRKTKTKKGARAEAEFTHHCTVVKGFTSSPYTSWRSGSKNANIANNKGGPRYSATNTNLHGLETKMQRKENPRIENALGKTTKSRTTSHLHGTCGGKYLNKMTVLSVNPASANARLLSTAADRFSPAAGAMEK